MAGICSFSGNDMCISEMKGNTLEIPEVFMEKVFSRASGKVVIREIKNGINVEAIDQEAVKLLLKAIEKLK